MYLIEKANKAQLSKGSLFRETAHFHGIPDDIFDTSDSCEIWGTSFTDRGPDYCEYRFFKSDTVTTYRVEGY